MECNIKDPILRNLVEFIAGSTFQGAFEQFFLDNALVFTDDEEQKLEYTEIYSKFQNIFDEFMADFLEENNITESEFSKRCRTALKEDPNANMYLDIVLASMDYKSFVILMKAMRRRANNEKAEIKDDSISKRKYNNEEHDNDMKSESKDYNEEKIIDEKIK